MNEAAIAKETYPSALRHALENIVGAEHVLWESSVPDRYQTALIPTQTAVQGVVKPQSLTEIQQVVRLAQEWGTPLYPISTGKNWGYGGSMPVTANNIVLDLSRMNRISIIDANAGVITVEPGVTQQKLAQYLQDNELPFRMDPSGGGPLVGVVGNILERGVGVSRYADHFSSVCSMEVVLGTGEVIRTGFGHYSGAQAAHHYKWGVGPWLDGLFTQSNLGIVTRIGLWLEPKPERTEGCYFQCVTEEQFTKTVEALGELMLHNRLPGSFILGNANRIISTRAQYPWSTMEQQTPMNPSALAQLTKEHGLGTWNGILPLYGDKDSVALMKKKVRAQLTGKVSKMLFVSDEKLRTLERFQWLPKLFGNKQFASTINAVRATYDLLSGSPTEASLGLSYWRNRQHTIPAKGQCDPLRDRCGLLWFVPILPLSQEHARKILTIVEPIHRRFGFDLCAGFLAMSSRGLLCSLPILYDRLDAKETEKALQCYEMLTEACRKEGYIPYRLPVSAMKECQDLSDPFWHIVHRLKDVFDPSRILSPGRYGA